MDNIFQTVFGWITTAGNVAWQKILAFMLVVLFCLFTYTAYEQRSQISSHIYTTISKVEYSINTPDVPQVLKDLMRDTGAVAAMTWEFDWATNQRRLIFAANKDGEEILKGLDILPILRPHSLNSPAVANALFASQQTCIGIDSDSSADIRAVKTTIPDVQVYCIGGLRTLYGEVRGAVAVFFTRTEIDQELVGAKLRNASTRILRTH